MNTLNSSLLGLGCPDCGGSCLGAIAFNTEPTSDWTCNDWVVWHQELVKAFKAGRFASGIKYAEADAIAQANKVFTQWWDKINSFWGSLNWCGYNTDFYTYFKNVGLTSHISFFASLVTPVTKGAIKVAESAGKVAENAGDAAEDASKTGSNIANTLTWLVPTVLVAGVVGLSVYAYKHYIKGNEKITVPKAKPSLGAVKKKKTYKKVIHI